MKNYKHKTPIQIRFKDLDEMGHVNNANHLSYIELARLKYFEDVVGTQIDWNKQHGLILARIEIDFKQPIFFEDTISVYTRCSRIGTKSFDLSWLILRENVSIDDSNSSTLEKPDSGHEVVAEGIAVLVCYDYLQRKPMEISQERKEKIQKYEGNINI